MKNCSRTSILNSDSVSRGPLVVTANVAQRLKAPLVDHSPHRPDIEQPANGRFAKAAFAYPGFQLGDPLLEHFTVRGGHLRRRDGEDCGSTPTAACNAGEP